MNESESAHGWDCGRGRKSLGEETILAGGWFGVAGVCRDRDVSRERKGLIGGHDSSLPPSFFFFGTFTMSLFSWLIFYNCLRLRDLRVFCSANLKKWKAGTVESLGYSAV